MFIVMFNLQCSANYRIQSKQHNYTTAKFRDIVKTVYSLGLRCNRLINSYNVFSIANRIYGVKWKDKVLRSISSYCRHRMMTASRWDFHATNGVNAAAEDNERNIWYVQAWSL